MSQVTNVLIIASFHLNQQKRNVANVPSHTCPEVIASFLPSQQKRSVTHVPKSHMSEVVHVGIIISFQCVPPITNALSVRRTRAQQAAKRLVRNLEDEVMGPCALVCC